MLERFLPDEYVKSIFEITPQFLMERNIRGIITDLDNTLVEWDRPLATPELTAWFKEMRNNGIQIVILSNNNEKRVHQFAKPLGIPYVYKARKPLKKAFHKAVSIMGLPKEETVMIGDQLLTDIFGGNLSKLNTILVVPVTQTDGLATRFNRMIERKILAMLNKKGLLQWEGINSGK